LLFILKSLTLFWGVHLSPQKDTKTKRVTHCRNCGRKLSDSNMTGECRVHWTPAIDSHRSSGSTGGGRRVGVPVKSDKI
jgi:hypothetical protein